MLVYRTQEERVATRPALAALSRDVAALARAHAPAHDDLIAVLVDASEIISGIVDVNCDARDDLKPVVQTLESAMLQVALAADLAWTGDAEQAPRALQSAGESLERVAQQPLPACVARRVSEGYVYYAVSPEAYAEVGRTLAAAVRGAPCVCVGIRSIGESLGAVVAAALTRSGVDASFVTIRPRGHPFGRVLHVGPAMRDHFRARAHGWFVVVDEGPGMSGSSFASVAAALSTLGVPHDRIVFVPSWDADGSSFVSAEARDRWCRHARRAATFEGTWIDGGRLARTWGVDAVEDLAAGGWRERAGAGWGVWVAVQPHHERRKFRVQRDGSTRWFKFEGLGRHARAAADRAAVMAGAGWGPPAAHEAGGWVSMDELAATPMRADMASHAFITHLGRYLAWVRETFPSDRATTIDEIASMLRHNVGERAGADLVPAVDRLISYAAIGAPVRLDARLFPHEWLQSGRRWIKTDALHHADDHFYPGPCDIAWDVAGALEEWRLDASGEAVLLETYVANSNDRDIARRLPFFRAAYLAARLGYCVMAADQLGTSGDARRFRAQVQHYRRRLRQYLAR